MEDTKLIVNIRIEAALLEVADELAERLKTTRSSIIRALLARLSEVPPDERASFLSDGCCPTVER